MLTRCRFLVVSVVVFGGFLGSTSTSAGSELQVCRRATHSDPLDNRGALDVRHHEMQLDCASRTWFFAATTNRTFTESDIVAFGVWISTDGNLNNGCGGFDRVLAGGFEGGRRFVEHWRTPTCWESTWTAAPRPVAFHIAGPVGVIGLEFKERWLRGDAQRMRYYGFLVPKAGLPDFLPEIGSHSVARPVLATRLAFVRRTRLTNGPAISPAPEQSPAPASAQFRFVPEQYPTIAGALAASSDGDVVVVGPGTYRGGLDYQGKEVQVLSSAGALRTTIDLANDYVDIADRASLSGFTVIGGSEAEWIRVFDLTPSEGGDVLISNNVFDGRGSLETGAIFDSDASVRIEGNVFRSVRCGDGVLSQSVIQLMAWRTATVRNNIFFDNPSCRAIAMWLGVGGNVRVANNTFVGNRTAVFIHRGASDAPVVIEDNIFQGHELAVERELGSGGQGVVPVTRANVFHSNTQDWNGPNAPSVGDGNVWGDPRFAFAAAGDFRLRRGSPAIDSGVDQVGNDVDVFGAARPFDGNVDGLAGWDIGAVEYQGVDAPRRDYVEVVLVVGGVTRYRNYGPLAVGNLNPETTSSSAPGPYGTLSGSAQLRGQRGGTATLRVHLPWRAYSVLRLGSMTYTDPNALVDRTVVVLGFRRVGLGVWQAWGVDGPRVLIVTIHER